MKTQDKRFAARPTITKLFLGDILIDIALGPENVKILHLD